MTEFSISLTRENIEEGPTHERATFGLLEIKAGENALSGALRNDSSRRNYQTGPYAPGYHLAEWLCWNWWRLRWEPSGPPNRTPTFEWDIAHRMSDIGGGYRWPNITMSVRRVAMRTYVRPLPRIRYPPLSLRGSSACHGCRRTI